MLPNITSFDKTGLCLVGKPPKSSLIFIASNPQLRKLSRFIQHLMSQEGERKFQASPRRELGGLN